MIAALPTLYLSKVSLGKKKKRNLIYISYVLPLTLVLAMPEWACRLLPFLCILQSHLAFQENFNLPHISFWYHSRYRQPFSKPCSLTKKHLENESIGGQIVSLLCIKSKYTTISFLLYPIYVGDKYEIGMNPIQLARGSVAGLAI